MTQTEFPIIFDGYASAEHRAEELKKQAKSLAARNIKVKIAAIVFEEDEGSLLYTDLKAQMAQRLNIDYDRYYFSLAKRPLQLVQALIKKLNQDSSVTGIIIQKPWKKTWQCHHPAGSGQANFNDWWQQLTSSLSLKKDVDGLHPKTLAAIKAGTWQEQGLVLPATAQAVLKILQQAEQKINQVNQKKGKPGYDLKQQKFMIIGRSDLLGQPLYAVLKQNDYQVENIGRKGLKQRIDQGIYLQDMDVIITATGRTKLITADMIKNQSVLIDVGEPRPDVDFKLVKNKCLFITPVPGGVGPMTVVELMANGLSLASRRV
jgi:methylenetetrahydrofolate dehydrogenase (NADP+)/methenyltetrahydrofolate cyclohydrolase